MTDKQEKKGLLELDISIKGVSSTQKLVFARYLAVMLKAGLNISEALEIIYDQGTGRFKRIIYKVMKSVNSGNTLSSSLSKFPKVFSSLFINAVYAGEASGTLEQNLENVAEQLKREKELISKVKGAMVYPIIVLVATFGLGLAMAFLVLPKITPLFDNMGMDLPFTTRILIRSSDIVQEKGFFLFAVIIFSCFFSYWFLRRKFLRPVTHWVLLRVPIIKDIIRNVNIARFCQVFGTLLRSGLNIDEALKITKRAVGNYYYQKKIEIICNRIGQGSPLSENLENFEAYFPKLVISMIKVGERTGKLEESLFYLSEFFDIEVDNSTKSLSTAIEPILLIGIGIAVGGMALSIITPIYQMTGNVSH